MAKAIGLYGLQSKILDGWILHLVSVKKITFKSSYSWFKIDILRMLRPPTAIFSHVQSDLNYFNT